MVICLFISLQHVRPSFPTSNCSPFCYTWLRLNPEIIRLFNQDFFGNEFNYLLKKLIFMKKFLTAIFWCGMYQIKYMLIYLTYLKK